MSKQGQHQPLLAYSELSPGKPHLVKLNGKRLLLCRVNDEVYAVDDMCTHEDISLSLGALCEHRLRCPLHGSEFDVRTGEVLDEPADSDLGTHAVDIIDGWICLRS